MHPKHNSLEANVRNRIRALLLFILVALPMAGQDCKLPFQTGGARPHKVTELKADAFERGERTRLCLKAFPWTDAQRKKVNAHGFPSSAEIGAVRKDIRSTNKLIKDYDVKGRFSPTEEPVNLFVSLGAEEWYSSLPKNMKFYVVHVIRGVDPTYADRFATMFYYLSLRNESKYEVIAQDAVAKAIRLRDTPKIENITSLDLTTNYSRAVVDAFLYLFTIEARARTTAKTADDYLELLLAHNAAPREALADLGIDFTTSFLEDRLSSALETEPNLKSKMLLGSRSGAQTLDYYARLSEGAQPRLIRYDKEVGSISILGGKDAWSALEETVHADLAAADPKVMTLASVLRDGKGFVVETASGAIPITPEQYAQLRRGEPLASDHALTKAALAEPPIVIYSNPLMRSGRYLADAEEFGFALQTAYPRTTVIRDDYNSETAARAAALASVGRKPASELVAVIDEGSFKVNDRNVLNDMEDTLRDKGWSIINYKPGTPWTNGTGKAVIVITGHIDENLGKFVRALGNAGYFRDNYVLLNTCYTTASTQLVAEINQQFGARACLRHEAKIAPYRVGELLNGIATDVAQPDGTESLLEILRTRMNALKLRALWIICHRENPNGYSAESGEPGA
jgi:hypothetical protein